MHLFKKSHYENLDDSQLNSVGVPLAIETVVKQRETVYDNNYREGYIIFRYLKDHTDPLYIFQPIWNLSSNIDENEEMLEIQDEIIDPILRQLPTPNTGLNPKVEKQQAPQTALDHTTSQQHTWQAQCRTKRQTLLSPIAAR